METSRTFSNVLEKFQKKRKDLVANLIDEWAQEEREVCFLC
jgi:hypothetical protein